MRSSISMLIVALVAGCSITSRYPTSQAAVEAARQAVVATAPNAAWDIGDAGEVIARGDAAVLVHLETGVPTVLGSLKLPYCVALSEEGEGHQLYAPCAGDGRARLAAAIEAGDPPTAGVGDDELALAAKRLSDPRTWPESWLLAVTSGDPVNWDQIETGIRRCVRALEKKGKVGDHTLVGARATGPTSLEAELLIAITSKDGAERSEKAAASLRPGVGGTRVLVECGAEEHRPISQVYAGVRAVSCEPVGSALWTAIETRVLKAAPLAVAGSRSADPVLDALFTADGDWYQPVPGIVNLSNADRVCVAQIEKQDADLRREAPLPEEFELRALSDPSTFHGLRREGRALPKGYTPAAPVRAEDGGWSWTLRDARCAPADEECVVVEVVCPPIPADQPAGTPPPACTVSQR
jgi:hypothetical protein